MTPIYRTKDQEHAFRQIEDVHNYSKLNRYDPSMDDNCQNARELTLSSNSSNQDEDDDEEDDENRYEKEKGFTKTQRDLENENTNATTSSLLVKPNQEKYNKLKLTEPHDPFIENERQTSPPEHHARRPMNAFLIFCKRHRCIVKDKYKNYENRAITKILGEWWASLDPNDKKCYINLAKQNKDAFFSANPNFKWYKLPAPSLRSLNTRPGNGERGDDQCELDNIASRNSLNFKDINPCSMPTNEVKNVSYFRLADEAQMGELNNLMYANSTPSKNKTVQKSLCSEPLFITTGCKLKPSGTNELALNSKRSHSDNSSSNSDDEFTPKKLVRSCKGKKYQEFINSGQITAVHSKNQISPNCAAVNNPFVLMRFDDCNKVTGSLNNDLSPTKEDESSWVMSHYKDSDEFNKEQYGFVSFDLEEKISKLPAQCLETYLQRKKTTKRKKKINSKKHSSILQPMVKEELSKETSQCLLNHKQKTALKVKELMVGSQKRKARKESITRRDISSIQNDVQVLLNNNSLIASSIETGRDSSSQLFSNNLDPTSDLLILAEAAAHRTETA